MPQRGHTVQYQAHIKTTAAVTVATVASSSAILQSGSACTRCLASSSTTVQNRQGKGCPLPAMPAPDGGCGCCCCLPRCCCCLAAICCCCCCCCHSVQATPGPGFLRRERCCNCWCCRNSGPPCSRCRSDAICKVCSTIFFNSFHWQCFCCSATTTWSATAAASLAQLQRPQANSSKSEAERLRKPYSGKFRRCTAAALPIGVRFKV